jgi:hypothetical protein
MKKAYFEALRLRVELRDNQHYHDLGYFLNNEETTRKIAGLLRLPAKEVQWDCGDGGFCLTLSLDKNNYAFTTYKQSLGEELWMFRGHEETHALHRLGRLDPLLMRLNVMGIEIPSNTNKEVLANVGGIYAMFIRRKNIRIYEASECKPEIVEAERIFREGIARKANKS